jgi:hypothetical protein
MHSQIGRRDGILTGIAVLGGQFRKRLLRVGVQRHLHRKVEPARLLRIGHDTRHRKLQRFGPAGDAKTHLESLDIPRAGTVDIGHGHGAVDDLQVQIGPWSRCVARFEIFRQHLFNVARTTLQDHGQFRLDQPELPQPASVEQQSRQSAGTLGVGHFQHGLLLLVAEAHSICPDG